MPRGICDRLGKHKREFSSERVRYCNALRYNRKTGGTIPVSARLFDNLLQIIAVSNLWGWPCFSVRLINKSSDTALFVCDQLFHQGKARSRIVGFTHQI